MVTNPPYGERISSPNLLGLYKTIGERLKHQFVGNDAWIIGYREETFEQLGLKPSLKIPLYNGSLNCEFCKYTIFQGNLNDFRAQGGIVKTDSERKANAERKRLKPHAETRPYTDRGELEGEIPDYIIRRHNEFVAGQQREARRQRRLEEDQERDNHKRTDRSRYANSYTKKSKEGGDRNNAGYRKEFRPNKGGRNRQGR